MWWGYTMIWHQIWLVIQFSGSTTSDFWLLTMASSIGIIHIWPQQNTNIYSNTIAIDSRLSTLDSLDFRLALFTRRIICCEQLTCKNFLKSTGSSLTSAQRSKMVLKVLGKVEHLQRSSYGGPYEARQSCSSRHSRPHGGPKLSTGSTLHRAWKSLANLIAMTKAETETK